MANISGAERPLKKIFDNDYLFEIPTYQRPYSWTIEQSSELLNDFLEALKEDQDEYFLGSIVLIKEKNDPQSDVVDGQQRLTTLTILFAALRNRVKNEKRADGLDQFIFEKGNVNLGTSDRPRLRVRDRDQEFFKKNIQNIEGISKLKELNKASLSEPKVRMYENALHYVKKLQELPESLVEDLIEYILNRCYLVVVSTDNFDSAYRIFTVLNDRGMELSHTDILKADIIGEMDSEDLQKQYANKWVNIEEELGREAFGNLFGYIRMIVRKKKNPASILEEFRKYVKPKENPVKFIDEQLIPYAEVLNKIINKDFESTELAEQINDYLVKLGQIDNSDWVPVALYFMKQYDNQPKILVTLLEKLERVAASMMIRRVYATQRISKYGDILEALENAGNDIEELVTIEVFDLSKKAIRETMLKLKGDIYEERTIRKYVLQRIDTELSAGGATYNRKTVTVEHVLPQNPKEDSIWVEWFPTEEVRDKYKHKLGNLLLLTRRKNSQAGNMDFEEKKENYFKTKAGVSNFAITTQVLREDKWTQEVIEDRQEEMISILRDTWNLDVEVEQMEEV